MQNPVRKFVGYCNQPNYQVVECLKREVSLRSSSLLLLFYNLFSVILKLMLEFVLQRETNRALNAEKSKIKREEVQKKLKGLQDDQ